MRISYYPDTDTLYIELKDAHGTHSRSCANDVVVDLDANDELLGIEIEYASKKTDLSRLKTEGLAQMRAAYDLDTSTRDVLLDAWYTQTEAVGGTTFHLELGGNGESARIVSDLLSKQTEFDPGQEKNPAAVALGKLGGAKGGKARAKNMTPEQRSEAARKAAKARWAKKRQQDQSS
jgi:uncharacterized protein YuzE